MESITYIQHQLNRVQFLQLDCEKRNDIWTKRKVAGVGDGNLKHSSGRTNIWA